MSSGSCANNSPPNCAIVKVWNVPTPFFEANRAAMTARSELIPYIYTAWRFAFETGVSLLRPMYYEFPQFDLAYAGAPDGTYAQYFFGADMIVAPVVVPASNTNMMAQTTIWVPPGTWYELATGVLLTGASDGSSTLTKSWDLTEVPILVRGGAILPTIPVRAGHVIATAQQQYSSLVFTVYPGATSGSVSIYEDDGKSMAYLQNSNAYAWLSASYTRQNISGSLVQLQFSTKLQGSFPQLPAQRTYQLRLVSIAPPTTVTVNGKSYPFSRYGASSTWHYDGHTLSAVIDIPAMSSTTQLSVTVTYPQVSDAVFSGIRGGIQHATLAKSNLDASGATPGSSTTAGGYLSMAATAGELFSMFAGTNQTSFMSLLNGYRTLFQGAVQELAALQPYPAGALLQLWDQDRLDSCLCGSSACMQTNNYYQQLRIEGYQPAPTDAGAVPLYDFWSDSAQDNWVTTQSTPPSGYSAAIFQNGYVLSTKQPNVRESLLLPC